ncbi:MAG: ferrous iron transporter B, partial [Acetanaerobacterium sp.]
ANDTLFGDLIGGNVSMWLESVGAAPWLMGLIVDGIIGGVGAVLGFVPQMFILFFFLSILEDCGYMARVAFIMDRIFRRFGLSGKSFIPMLISSGCAVPGIMASRTIENEKDRRMTIMLTSFVPCGAKLPIIALIAGAFFPGSSWVAPSAYFLGVGMIILSGIILKKTRLFAGDPAPFVMELPQYHLPGLKGVLIHMWERGKAFVIKAFTVIFVACGVIWFLSNFGWNLQMVEDSANSMLATLGGIIAPLLAPLGFGTWQGAVATLSALVAKENAVAAFGVLFGIADASENDPTLLTGIATMFTAVSGYAFLAFNLFNPPCFAAVGAMKREFGGWKWTWITLGYQTVLAYVVAFIINQFGRVLFLGFAFNVATVIAILLIGAIVWLLFRSYTPKGAAPVSNEKAHA